VICTNMKKRLVRVSMRFQLVRMLKIMNRSVLGFLAGLLHLFLCIVPPHTIVPVAHQFQHSSALPLGFSTAFDVSVLKFICQHFMPCFL